MFALISCHGYTARNITTFMQYYEYVGFQKPFTVEYLQVHSIESVHVTAFVYALPS